jgi:DNA-binding MarR family transcriptional regulator
MAKVVFSITDAQVAALRRLAKDPDSTYSIDPRCVTGLEQRGLIETPQGKRYMHHVLTPVGKAALRLVEMLAMPRPDSGAKSPFDPSA